MARNLAFAAIALIAGLIVASLVVFKLVQPAYGHDHEHPELDGWFMGLQSKGKSPCCDGADAMRLNDVDWESKDGHYRVRLGNKWVDVPEGALVEGPNRDGRAMVWPYLLDGEPTGVRCFMPGALT